MLSHRFSWITAPALTVRPTPHLRLARCLGLPLPERRMGYPLWDNPEAGSLCIP